MVAIAGAALACAAEEDARRVQTPAQLDVVERLKSYDGSLTLDGVHTDAIAFNELRGIGGDLWIRVSPETHRIDLPELLAINGVLGVYADAPSNTPLVISAPKLERVSGFINFRNLNDLLAAFPALEVAGGLYLFDVERPKLDFPALKAVNGAIDIERMTTGRISLPNAKTSLGFMAAEIDSSMIDARSIQSVSDRVELDSVTRSNIDLGSLDSPVYDVIFSAPPDPITGLQGPAIVSSTIALGAISIAFDLRMSNSVLELGSTALEHLSLHADHATVRLPKLTDVSNVLSVSGAIVLDAPELVSVGRLEMDGGNASFLKLASVDRLVLTRVASDLLYFPQLTSIRHQLTIAALESARVVMPKLTSIGTAGETDDCKNGVAVLRNPRLSSFELPLLREVSGDVWIQYNPQLLNCSVMDQIQGVHFTEAACEILVLDNAAGACR